MPKSAGFWFIGEANVLSIMVMIFRSFAKFAIAFISVIPNNGFDGVSMYKTLVFSLKSDLKSSTLSDSVKEYLIPYFSNSVTIKL